MKNIRILACTSVEPPHFETTANILPFVKEWLKEEDKRTIDKAVKIYEMANISKRHSIMSAKEVFSPGGFGDKNDIFVREMKILAEQALEKVLNQANLQGNDIDCIISVSCTGIMIPSMDAYLVNRFQMKRDIVRLPVTEMGCAGGTASMIYAYEFLKGNPGKKVAIVTFESPTATLQHHDHSMTNIVSTALFGDGVSAVILSSDNEPGIVIVDGAMYHFYNETGMMGFQLTNHGLKMILEAEVPDKINDHFDELSAQFLGRQGLSLNDIRHLLFHPGGRKIVELMEGKFEKSGKKLDMTKEILYHYGNMSSATVHYVLERYMKEKVPAGDWGLMLSFGPGFTAQFILLKWQ